MKYRVPTLCEYQILKYSDNTAEVLAIARCFAEINSTAELQCFLTEFFTGIETERAKNPQLCIPYYPEYSDEPTYYNCNSTDIKIVSDYTRLDFLQIQELGIFTFWGWLHDAVVWNCLKSEDGQDYLEKCWCISQTEPDYDAWNAISD